MSVPNPATTDWVPMYAGTVGLAYLGDYVPATSYKDGDVVVKDGVAFMCVGGPTTVAPDAALWGAARLDQRGDELAYAEITVNVTVSATALPGTDVIAAPALTFDGATKIRIEFFAPIFEAAGASTSMGIYLFDGATCLGRIGYAAMSPAVTGMDTPIKVERVLTPSAGTHTYSLKAIRGGANGTIYAGAGGVTAGDQLPAFIRVTRVSAVPPQIAVGSVTPVTYGLTLPSPQDGQEAILVDSLTAPTYQWRFRYNAASSSAYKWEFVGGASYRGQGGSLTTSSTTPTNIAGFPAMTLARAGTYRLLVGAQMSNTGTYNGPYRTVMQVFIGGAAQGYTLDFAHHTAAYMGAMISTASEVTVAAGSVLTLRGSVDRALASGGETGISTPWVDATPVRVA